MYKKCSRKGVSSALFGTLCIGLPFLERNTFPRNTFHAIFIHSVGILSVSRNGKTLGIPFRAIPHMTKAHNYVPNLFVEKEKQPELRNFVPYHSAEDKMLGIRSRTSSQKRKTLEICSETLSKRKNFRKLVPKQDGFL